MYKFNAMKHNEILRTQEKLSPARVVGECFLHIFYWLGVFCDSTIQGLSVPI